MTVTSTMRAFLRLLALALVMLNLAACGGGSGGGGGGTSVSASLSGVAATGAAVDGVLYVTDVNGVEVNTPIDPDGSFTLSVQGMTPPFMLRVVPNGTGAVLYSFVAHANATVNVTPLTTLALYLAGGTDLDALYNTWSSGSATLSDAAIEAEQEIINANLAALFGGNGIDASFYDFMSVGFTADGTGIDGVLDVLNVSIDFVNDTFSVEVNGTPFAWDAAIDTSDINIGDFPVSDSSTWQLSITDSANNIATTEIVTGLSVPNDLQEIDQITRDELNGQYYLQGLQITVSLSELSYDLLGAGEIGTLISGVVRGTVRIVGTYNGQPVNETVQLNTAFAWERLT